MGQLPAYGHSDPRAAAYPFGDRGWAARYENGFRDHAFGMSAFGMGQVPEAPREPTWLVQEVIEFPAIKEDPDDALVELECENVRTACESSPGPLADFWGHCALCNGCQELEEVEGEEDEDETKGAGTEAQGLPGRR